MITAGGARKVTWWRLVLIAVTLGVGVYVPVYATYYAVIAGVADYPGTVNDLEFTDDDAIAMHDAFLMYANWQDDDIVLLLDSAANKAAIHSALLDIAAEGDSDDVFVFYFSGHGTTYSDLAPLDESDGVDEYICPYGGDISSFISDDELSAWLDLLPMDRIIVMLDTCFSGGQIKGVRSMNAGPAPRKGDGFGADLETIAHQTTQPHDLDDVGKSIVVLTASDDDEYSWEFDAPYSHGLFTYHLLDAMSGEADLNANARISGEECYGYLVPRVVEDSQNWTTQTQHPQLLDRCSGELEFLNAASDVAVSILPGSIQCNTGETKTVDVVVDSLPSGLSGYQVRVSLGTPAVGTITSVTAGAFNGAWSVVPTPPADSVTFYAADFSGDVDPGATNVTLATITLRCDSAGTSAINVEVLQMDDDSGGPISASVQNGMLNCDGCVNDLPFVDDFSGSLDDNWELYGNPLPSIRTDVGNPAPCFENNGDSWYDSGAISRATFDYSEGLVIESDLFVEAESVGCWVAANFGMLRNENYGEYKSAEYSLMISSGYSGTYCNSHAEGVIDCFIVKDDGSLERYTVTHDDEYLNAWHHFKIVIDPTRHVRFYIDGELFYSTEGQLSLDYNCMPLLLGNRSSSYGTALHDNVTVTDYSGCAFDVMGTASLEGGGSPSAITVDAWLNGTSANTVATTQVANDGLYTLTGLPCMGTDDTGYTIVGRCNEYANDYQHIRKPDGTTSAQVRVPELALHSQKQVVFEWVYQPNGARSFLSDTTQGTTTLLSIVEGDDDQCGFIFSTETVTSSVADVYFGDWESDPYGFWANNGVGGVIDMGPVPIEDVLEAPASGYDAQWTPVVVGHTYCVLTRDGSAYTKLHVTGAGSAGQCCALELGDWWFEQDGSTIPSSCLSLDAPDGATLHIVVSNPCSVEVTPGSLLAPFPPGQSGEKKGGENRFFDPIPAGSSYDYVFEYTREELNGYFYNGDGSYSLRAGVTSMCGDTETEWNFLAKTICVTNAGDNHCWSQGTVQIQASGSGADTSNWFGVDPSGTDCFDSLDIPEPPASPAPYTALWFVLDASCCDTTKYTKDIKASIACNEVKPWTLKVADEGSVQQVTLSWDLSGAQFGDCLSRVVLTDLVTGTVTDMTSHAQYTYTKQSNPETREFTITVDCGSCQEVCTNLAPTGWHMMTIPGDLYPNCPCGAEGYGNLCCAICDDIDPCFIFRYDPIAGGYVMVPPCETIDYQAGMGVWVRTYTDPVSVCADVTLKAEKTCIALQTGWNQIGNPFNFEVALSNVTVKYQGNEVSLQQAQQNGWVSMYLFGYDTANGGYGMLDPTNGQLEPWAGYWMRAYVDCEVCISPIPAPPGPPTENALIKPQALGLSGISMPPSPPNFAKQVNEDVVSQLSVSNVPNPIRSRHTTTFKVEGKGAELVQAIRVEIYDQSGQKVFTQDINAKELEWHTDNGTGELLANGVYLYQVWVKIAGQWYPTGIHKLAVVR